MLPWAFRGLASGSVASGSIPVGLELYSVRDALKQDPEGTLRAVAQMGYQAVEFYAPYFEWTETQAKQTRKLLDDLGMRCYSTHNDADYLEPKNINRARDLNLILGTKYVVLAWSDPKSGADGWKAIADKLNSAAETLEPSGLKPGYHNHQAEFTGAARAASHRDHRQEHEAFCDAAIGRRHLPGSRLRPCRLDPSQPGTHSLHPL